MTAITNTATTLTTKGIREDLEDTIYRVAPTKTPFQNNIGNGGKANNTYHEWQLENPDAPSASNFQLEGDDVGSSFGAENVTSRAHYERTSRQSAVDQSISPVLRGFFVK